MGNIMTEPTPIVVNDRAIQDAIVTGFRYLGTIVGGVAAVFGLATKGDIAGLTAYFQGADGLALIGAVTAVGGLAYGAWKAYHNKTKMVSVAKADPQDVIVK